MKCFYTTRYNITTNKLFHKIKILILSDLHFSYKVKDKKLSLIISEVERVQADYILFVGDLVDSLDMISDENEMNRFIQFFHKLSSVSKLIISLGNHDCYKKRIVNGKFCGWNEFFDEIFINRLKNYDSDLLLVELADKLQNLVSDYELFSKQGKESLPTEGKNYSQIKWFYTSLKDLFNEKLNNNTLLERYNNIYEEYFKD